MTTAVSILCLSSVVKRAFAVDTLYRSLGAGHLLSFTRETCDLDKVNELIVSDRCVTSGRLSRLAASPLSYDAVDFKILKWSCVIKRPRKSGLRYGSRMHRYGGTMIIKQRYCMVVCCTRCARPRLVGTRKRGAQRARQCQRDILYVRAERFAVSSSGA